MAAAHLVQRAASDAASAASQAWTRASRRARRGRAPPRRAPGVAAPRRDEQREVPHAALPPARAPWRGRSPTCRRRPRRCRPLASASRRVRTKRRPAPGGRAEHQLADVAAGLQRAEGALRLAAAWKVRRAAAGACPSLRRSRDTSASRRAAEGRARRAAARPHRPRSRWRCGAAGAARMRRFGEVALAELDEAAEGAEQAERALHRPSALPVTVETSGTRGGAAARPSSSARKPSRTGSMAALWKA